MRTRRFVNMSQPDVCSLENRRGVQNIPAVVCTARDLGNSTCYVGGRCQAKGGGSLCLVGVTKKTILALQAETALTRRGLGLA